MQFSQHDSYRAASGYMKRDELWRYKDHLVHSAFHAKAGLNFHQMDLMAAIAGYTLPATADWGTSEYLQFYRFKPIIGIPPVCVSFNAPKSE